MIVFYYSLKLLLCNNMFCIKVENREPKKKKKKKNLGGSNWDFFVLNWEKTYFLALGMGPKFHPKIG